MNLECPHCGLVFSSENPNRRYCSQRCCWLAWRDRNPPPSREFKPFPCLTCGVLVTQAGRRRFCSARCGTKWSNDQRSPVRHPKPCLGCGELFVPRTRLQKHCEPSCRPQRQKRCVRCGEAYSHGAYKYCCRACQFPPEPRRPRPPPETRPCPECGAEMLVRRKFCSRACSAASQRAKPIVCAGCGVLWERSSNQRQMGYDRCWECRRPKPRTASYRHVKTELKKRLVAREKDKCQDCRRTAKQVGEPLHAHHVVPQALGGTNGLSNLKLLCPDCHLGSGWERNHSLLLMAGMVVPKKVILLEAPSEREDRRVAEVVEPGGSEGR